MIVATVGQLEIEIIDPFADPPLGAPADVAGVAYEPPARGPSRLELFLHRAERLERRLDSTFFRLGCRRAQAQSGNARRDSRVRQHIWLPFSVVRSRLADSPSEIRAGSARLVLSSGFNPTPRGAIRAEGTLRLRGSWPPLPVWVTVEPWWRSRTVATIALRTRKRWRYPRRYFAAAHAVTRHLARTVDPRQA